MRVGKKNNDKLVEHTLLLQASEVGVLEGLIQVFFSLSSFGLSVYMYVNCSDCSNSIQNV